MDPTQLREHLDDLCERLDQRRPLRAVTWAGAALVASGTLLGCGDDGGDTGAVDLYGAPPVEICDDEVDNDDDGDIDCADEDCIDDPACVDVGLYSAPEA